MLVTSWYLKSNDNYFGVGLLKYDHVKYTER